MNTCTKEYSTYKKLVFRIRTSVLFGFSVRAPITRDHITLHDNIERIRIRDRHWVLRRPSDEAHPPVEQPADEVPATTVVRPESAFQPLLSEPDRVCVRVSGAHVTSYAHARIHVHAPLASLHDCCLDRSLSHEPYRPRQF